MNVHAGDLASPTTLLALDSALLRTLVAVADTGSFATAARAVHRTPSAISMQMKKLEGQIGRPLFARQGRSVVLTPEGETLLTYARRILKLAEEAVIRFHGASRAGTVRIGTPDDFAATFLPPILARFAVMHPLVEINVTCGVSSTLVRMLEEGELDIAFVTAGGTDHTASSSIVYRDRLVWAGLAHGTAHERRPLPLAMGPPCCWWRKKAIEPLDTAGISHRVACTSEHYAGQIIPVLAGLALAPLPLAIVPSGLKPFGEEDGLPPLGHSDLELRRNPLASGELVEAVADHVAADFRARQVV